MIKSKTKP